MAPLPIIEDESINAQVQTATQHDVQYAAESLASTLRVVIMILAGLTLATGALYFLLRRSRLRRGYKLVWPSTPQMVFESSVSIEFDDEDEEEGTVVDVEECHGRASMETILSNGTPRRLTFDVSKIMPFLERRRSNILDRRGKTTLQCDTTAYYETNIIPTKTMSPIDRKICRPKVHFLDNLASPLSPFWSRQAAVSSPTHRPVFGFTSKTITPPLGSPLWQARSNGRIPNRKDYWTP